MKKIFIIPLALLVLMGAAEPKKDNIKDEQKKHDKKVAECKKFKSQEEWHKRFMANEVLTKSPCDGLK